MHGLVALRSIMPRNIILTVLLCMLLPVALAAGENRLANRTIERTIQLRTHSIFAPYIDQDLQNRWWDFGADSYINTNKYIRLTRSRPSQMGWLWSRLPLTSTNFVIEVEFKITGESSHLYGDGMALWLTTTRAEPGPVFGSVDKFEGLAIFLDTYANAQHSYGFPRVVAMMGDGNTNYDQANDGEANSLGSCSGNFRRTNGVTKLKLTYVKDGYIDVKMHHRAWEDWTDCLRIEGVNLPPSFYLGLSAMTGEVFDSHDILSVTTSSAILSSEDAPRDKLGGRIFSSPRDSQSGSWFGFLFKLSLFAGVCVGVFYGYKSYTVRNRYGHNSTFGLAGASFSQLGGDRLGFSNGKRF